MMLQEFSDFDNTIKHLAQITPRAPDAITFDIGWQIIDVVQKELIPAMNPKTANLREEIVTVYCVVCCGSKNLLKINARSAYINR